MERKNFEHRENVFGSASRRYQIVKVSKLSMPINHREEPYVEHPRRTDDSLDARVYLQVEVVYQIELMGFSGHTLHEWESEKEAKHWIISAEKIFDAEKTLLDATRPLHGQALGGVHPSTPTVTRAVQVDS